VRLENVQVPISTNAQHARRDIVFRAKLVLRESASKIDYLPKRKVLDYARTIANRAPLVRSVPNVTLGIHLVYIQMLTNNTDVVHLVKHLLIPALSFLIVEFVLNQIAINAISKALVVIVTRAILVI